MIGETKLDAGPGDKNLTCAKSVKPAANVGVGLGISVNGINSSVGTAVKVGRTLCVKASAVAKAACPVRATTVGMEGGGKVVGVDPIL